MNWPPLMAIPIYWHLPVLLVIVSLIYSATRFEQWDAIVREAWRWGLRMAVFLVGVGAVLLIVAYLL
jgi:hypothetical protein